MKERFSICITALICSVIISFGMTKIFKQDRSVTVRGLAEKEVAADLAIWPLTFSTGSNNLSELQTEILSKTEIVEKYLEDHGLTSEDYTIRATDITDMTTNPYLNPENRKFNYVAKQTVLIRSSKVEKVKEALQDSLLLAGSEIAVSQDYESKIKYEFTGLNEIKPEMIALATENARAAAEQFARDSKCKVGKIKKATQGLFTIEDAAQGLEEKKNIRVVTTIEYSLK